MATTRILFLAVILGSLANGAVAAQPLDRDALTKMSEEERNAFLQELDARVLQLREQREKALQERQAALDARRKQAAAENAAREGEAAAKYEVDPLLKKAYLMYKDFAKRDRNEVVAAFEEYLRRNPDSVFRAEVYHCMGAMYAGNANRDHGETVDLQKMREYYLKAHEAFGGRFSVDAMLVYNKLAFLGGTFQQRLEYYDWLRYMEEKGTPEDLYPIRGIGTCISGFPPEYASKEALDKALNHAKNDLLPQEIRATEQQLFRDSFQPARNALMDLSILANLYPHTELGRQAIHAVEQAYLEMGLSTMLESGTSGAGPEIPSVQTGSLEPSPKAEIGSEQVAPTPEPRSERQVGKSMSLPAAVAAVVLVALVGLGTWFRKKRQNCPKPR
jgi:hypothetical protein